MATAQFEKSLTAIVVTVTALSLGASRADAFVQTNLVSDIPGLATITDPSLQNPWGMAELAMSPIWSANQATNTSTLYNVMGSTSVSKVNINPPIGFVGIPTTASGPQGPTGMVSNANTAAFQLVPGMASTSARFIFANLNGTISGWAGGLTATIKVTETTPAALYTGLAINSAQITLRIMGGPAASTFSAATSPH
jgi:hypothetical protein